MEKKVDEHPLYLEEEQILQRLLKVEGEEETEEERQERLEYVSEMGPMIFGSEERERRGIEVDRPWIDIVEEEEEKIKKLKY